jgi:hypothetical protein
MAARADAVRRVADAVLYEGYILWPYRKSALKNQRRFAFGGVYPPGGDDPSTMQTQCLLEANDHTRVEVTVRFLQLVERQVYRGPEPVEELEVGDERYLSWEEAAERELTVVMGMQSRRRVPIEVVAGTSREALGGEGSLVRRWETIEGMVELRSERLRSGLFRLTVQIENTGAPNAGSRDARTLRSTHTVLAARGGAFVSLTDPPPERREEAEACENVGTWPVLAGEEGDRSTLLSSPIILPDYPQIAPESPGDLFDATEIDQMLVLNILSLTDEEKREMRDCDPRAREILERTESLSEEELMRLHGAIRDFGPVAGD